MSSQYPSQSIVLCNLWHHTIWIEIVFFLFCFSSFLWFFLPFALFSHEISCMWKWRIILIPIFKTEAYHVNLLEHKESVQGVSKYFHFIINLKLNRETCWQWLFYSLPHSLVRQYAKWSYQWFYLPNWGSFLKGLLRPLISPIKLRYYLSPQWIMCFRSIHY